MLTKDHDYLNKAAPHDGRWKRPKPFTPNITISTCAYAFCTASIEAAVATAEPHRVEKAARLRSWMETSPGLPEVRQQKSASLDKLQMHR